MKERRFEILGILIIAISLLVLVSLFGYNSNEDPVISPNILIENPMGIVGVFLAYFLIKFTFGYASFVFPFLGILWGWWFFSRKKLKSLNRVTGYILGAAFLFSVTAGLISIIIGEGTNNNFVLSGLIGGTIAKFLMDILGSIGVMLVLVGAWLILVRGFFSWSFYKPIDSFTKKVNDWQGNKRLKKKLKISEDGKRKHTENLLSTINEQEMKQNKDSSGESETKPDTEEDTEEPPSDLGSGLPSEDETHEEPELVDHAEGLKGITGFDDKSEQGKTEDKIGSGESVEVGEMVKEKEINLDSVQDRQVPKQEYKLPSTDLLTTPVSISEGMSRDELLDRAKFLTQSLATFGVEGKVVNVHPGPVITLFEVEPAEGVRVNKFVQLSDDLARVMEASRVRVIAPIPGKSSVGIEIPNRHPAIVYFKSVINSEKFANSTSKLTLAIGKNTSGEIATLDLAQMPHLLIAGTTGSGKSVCLNTIVCSILYQATPDEVKFMIIDPKKVEMTLYRALAPYYLLKTEDFDEPIVTTMENAVLALRALENEMDNRYVVLADAVVRNIDEYNKKMKKEDQPIMPYIILVIDELADLMMMSAKDVETPIARLAQLARAVGIHLVIATQRPSVDVITGIIKANFPSRIAFQVVTKIDSRTILDTQGAEKLIGRGDMLFQGFSSPEPVRLHNAYVSLEEIEAIMSHIREQPVVEELKLASVRQVSSTDFTIDDGSRDELLDEAIRLVVIHQQGSISLLQRRLKVGYSRAARLIDEMEKISVVGPFTGSKAREVLVDESYLEVIKP